MQNLRRYRPYEEKFLMFSLFVEKILIKILVLLIIALFLSQLLLSFDLIRNLLVPVEKLEGTVSFLPFNMEIGLF